MKRWLLVPLLLPLAAALAVGALNWRVPTRLRLLVWTSPPLPLGAWVLLAAGGGAVAAAVAGLSAPGSGARVPEPWEEPRRRRTRRPLDSQEEPFDSADSAEPMDQPEPGAQPAPERSPHEAPPTVAVPFRVVQRSARGPAVAAAPAVDDWADAPDDDW